MCHYSDWCRRQGLIWSPEMWHYSGWCRRKRGLSGTLDRSISPEMCQRLVEEEGDGQFWEAKPQNPWHLLLPAFSKLPSWYQGNDYADNDQDPSWGWWINPRRLVEIRLMMILMTPTTPPYNTSQPSLVISQGPRWFKVVQVAWTKPVLGVNRWSQVPLWFLVLLSDRL